MRVSILAVSLFLLLALPALAAENDCVTCHTEQTPNIVTDWKLSGHHEAGIGCADCHGGDHSSADDVA